MRQRLAAASPHERDAGAHAAGRRMGVQQLVPLAGRRQTHPRVVTAALTPDACPERSRMPSSYDRILSYVAELDIIDTHEHLPPFEDQRDAGLDGIQEYIMDYFNRDLRSAGMPPDDLVRVKKEAMPLMERWRLVAPYWELARYTGYGRALDISARGLYGLDGVHEGTIEALDAAVRGSHHPGHYEYVLRTKSKIVISLLDGGRPSDQRYFRNVLNLDAFVFPKTVAGARHRGLDRCARLLI